MQGPGNLNHSESDQDLIPAGPVGKPRSNSVLVAVGLCALLLFSVFVALGIWQIKRLHWKLDLIARVDQRVHAVPTAIPPPSRWNTVTAESDEYTHVSVTGVFLNQYSSHVLASTVLGRGYWLMTPLQLADGTMVYVNRGFQTSKDQDSTIQQSTSVTLTGLLRITEPHGGFLQANDPAHQHWTSRAIAAMAASYGLGHVAPYFIDAEAADGQPFDPSKVRTNDLLPVPGLTVIAFNNSHLVYTITWFALALMVVFGSIIIARAELNARRQSKSD